MKTIKFLTLLIAMLFLAGISFGQATYYIDLDNGTDGVAGTVHDGLKEDNAGANYTSIAGTDATHIYIAKTTLDNNTDDNYNGDYLYNVTRSLGALISDYDAADNGNSIITHGNIAAQTDGDLFFIIRAWKTLAKYTTTEARTPGDLAYVRANTTEVYGGYLDCDEAGDEDNWIEIRGCSSTDDPWGDGSDVKPSFSFGDAAFGVILDDDYWKLNRIIFKEASKANWGVVNLSYAKIYILDCEFTDHSDATGTGLSIGAGSDAVVEGCVFKDNIINNLRCDRAKAKVIDCTFDGGATHTDYGVYAIQSQVEAINCSFGQTTAHDTADVYADSSATIKTRNCLLDVVAEAVTTGASVFSEDDDAVYGASLITYYHGTVTKDTGVTRVGGASSSAKMEPNTNCGLNNPLTLNHDSIINSPFKIWLTGGAEKTITIYIRSFGVWGTYPTNVQLYTIASYLDHAVDATRTEVASTAVLADETTWVAFTTTFTPLQDGFVYVNVYMAHFEAAKGCYVDIKPIIS